LFYSFSAQAGGERTAESVRAAIRGWYTHNEGDLSLVLAMLSADEAQKVINDIETQVRGFSACRRWAVSQASMHAHMPVCG
jgi:hypothetical protein